MSGQPKHKAALGRYLTTHYFSCDNCLMFKNSL